MSASGCRGQKSDDRLLAAADLYRLLVGTSFLNAARGRLIATNRLLPASFASPFHGQGTQTAGPSPSTRTWWSPDAGAGSGTCFRTLGLGSVGLSGCPWMGFWESTKTPRYPRKTLYIQFAARGPPACWGGPRSREGEDPQPLFSEQWDVGLGSAPTATASPCLPYCHLVHKYTVREFLLISLLCMKHIQKSIRSYAQSTGNRAVYSPPVSGRKLVPEPPPARHPGAGPAIWNVGWAGSHARTPNSWPLARHRWDPPAPRLAPSSRLHTTPRSPPAHAHVSSLLRRDCQGPSSAGRQIGHVRTLSCVHKLDLPVLCPWEQDRRTT